MDKLDLYREYLNPDILPYITHDIIEVASFKVKLRELKNRTKILNDNLKSIGHVSIFKDIKYDKEYMSDNYFEMINYLFDIIDHLITSKKEIEKPELNAQIDNYGFRTLMKEIQDEIKLKDEIKQGIINTQIEFINIFSDFKTLKVYDDNEIVELKNLFVFSNDIPVILQKWTELLKFIRMMFVMLSKGKTISGDPYADIL